MFKFGHMIGDEDVAYRHPHVWARTRTSTGTPRLDVGPAHDHVGVLKKLTREMPEPFAILYVLVVPRNESQLPGRYQSPFLTRTEMERFLDMFGHVFEGDARAALWVAALPNGSVPVGFVVYDRHDCLHAYGPIGKFEEALERMGLKRADRLDLPSPHTHHYHEEFDSEVEAILSEFSWSYSELREEDEI